MNNDSEFQKMIEKYKNEMKKYIPDAIPAQTQPQTQSQTQTQTQPQTQPELIELQPPEEQPLINNLDFTADFTPPSVPNDEIIIGSTENLTGEGYLRIQVFSGRAALPIPDASVFISSENGDGENEKLLYFFTTDNNGLVPTVELPTVSAEESQQPGMKNPYAAYNIRVEKTGFFISELRNVPVFDGLTATKSIDLVPLPDFYNGSRLTIVEDTGSITLNP